MKVDRVCKRCGEEDEDVKHLLLCCPKAKMLWYLSPLWLTIECVEGESFRDWVEKRRRVCEVRECRGVGWWLNKAVGVVGEYQKAMEAVKVTRGFDLRGGAAWVFPPLGGKKLNTNEAKREGRLIGLGVIVRDEGLKVAWEAGFRTLIMESDCLSLVEAVKKKKKCHSQFG
ncbi:Opacity protein opA67 [Bienertia sinuspersici]